ncbi:uncharacterized protein LOC112500523 [Cynara cardunculus var. scolymus]|uniref:Uncharacterized protein n=1 Tax=Cynara cardunculus var. scolymus TaxID=59895 RepID=A0A118K0X3_CYNCS|nr:uncharacterized protein LOC112500523 [Cynara cardunculus var. scolymus]KVI01983.1 hypothetical protein Ccrd_019764 [Cynara cardunculus var. scolymus]
MSTPNSFDPTQQQQPPLLPVTERQDFTSHSHHGSVGPAIGALAVIMVLAAIAVVIGRLCSGRKIMGHRQYDFEGWVETKCSSCIDGKLGPPPPPPCVAAPATVESIRSNLSSSEAPAAAAAAARGSATHGEPHEEEIHHNLREA